MGLNAVGWLMKQVAKLGTTFTLQHTVRDVIMLYVICLTSLISVYQKAIIKPNKYACEAPLRKQYMICFTYLDSKMQIDGLYYLSFSFRLLPAWHMTIN